MNQRFLVPVGLCLVLLVSLVSASVAMAAPRRLGVVPFSGPGAAAVQKGASKAIPPRRFRLITVQAPDGELDDAAAQAAAAENKLVGVLSGQTSVRGRTLTAALTLRDAEGMVVAEKSWTSRKGAGLLARLVRKGVWRAFGESLASLRPRPARKPGAGEEPVADTSRAGTPTRAATPSVIDQPPAMPPEKAVADEPVRRPAHAEADTDVEAEEKAAPTGGARPTTLELAVGPRVATRSLSYNNVPAGGINDFSTSRPAAALGFAVAFFPRLALPRLGLMVEGEYGARVRATTENDLTYELRTNEVVGAAVIGLPSRWVTVDLAVGGGLHDSQVVALDDVGNQPPPVPDIAYRFLRGGLGMHIYTGTRLSFSAGAYYRHLLGTGAIASDDWFPRLQAYGLEFMVGANYRIVPWLEARLQVDGRRYRFHMNAEEGDRRLAGGAVDQYLGAWLGLAALFGG
jgi:hypothetical protein